MSKGMVCIIPCSMVSEYTYLPSYSAFNWLFHIPEYLQNIERPFTLLEEEAQMRKFNPVARVEKMFSLLSSKLNGPPKLILCVLPERKNCDIYGISFSNVFQCFLYVDIFVDIFIHRVLCKFQGLGKGSVWVMLGLSHSAFPLSRSLINTSLTYFLKSILR